MSNLPGENYHAAKSLEIHNRVARTNGMATHQAMYDMACAQNLATLALAYEQRTANLIAYVEKIDDQTLVRERCAEIAHRLGLQTSSEMRAEK